MQRSVRVFVVTVMVATAALFAIASPAGAKGKPVTAALNCSDGVSGINATVQMRAGGLFGQDVGAQIQLSCVTSGVQSKTSKDAPKADSFSYSWSYGSSVPDCTGGGGSGFDQRGNTVTLLDCHGVTIGTLSVK
jgi:hypothetical protein